MLALALAEIASELPDTTAAARLMTAECLGMAEQATAALHDTEKIVYGF